MAFVEIVRGLDVVVEGCDGCVLVVVTCVVWNPEDGLDEPGEGGPDALAVNVPFECALKAARKLPKNVGRCVGIVRVDYGD